MKNYLILSIDLDEWYHARWATGSPNSRWKNTKEFFREYYQSERPIGEIIGPTRRILGILKKENIRATFFILGEVAEWYPDLVKEIAGDGHEIACHGLHHQDLNSYSAEEFSEELRGAKKILEDLTQDKVIGFRAPNLIFPKWLPEILIAEGFLYDSSICPSRKLFGKYGGQSNLPQNPYRIKKNLIELPIPVFPFLKLPGAVSIMTRILGFNWTKITLESALKAGAASYYLHPYELNPPPKLKQMSLKQRIFWLNSGSFLEKNLQKIISHYKNRIVSARDYISKYFEKEL